VDSQAFFFCWAETTDLDYENRGGAGEIRADMLAPEKVAEGLLVEIIGATGVG
jgi:hypothetical protein